MTVTRDEVTPQLEAMRDRLAHPAPVLLGPVTDAIHEMEQRHFLSGGDGEWPSLAPSTERRKQYQSVLSDAPLMGAGSLYESLTVRGASYGHASMLDDSTLSVGTDAPGGLFAEMGTINEPRRPPIPDDVPQADTDRMAALVGDWITEGRLQ